MDAQNKSLVNIFFTGNLCVKFVRLQWVDYSGVLRTRIITKGRCQQLASGSDYYQLAQNCMVIPLSTAPRCWPDGIEEWNLCPDWTSLRVCGFAPTHASVMCATANRNLSATDHFARCPRKLLSKVLDAFDKQDKSKLLMGFEIEFVLLDETFNLAKSMDQTVGYSMTAGLRTEKLVVMEEIVAALEVSGIEVYHFHTEIVDQFEVALSPMPPMQAIDALMMAQETIRTIFLRYGLRATMAPKPVFNGPQSGCHVHVSLNPGTKDSSASFLAGVLCKLKPLCTFGLANYDSYYRVSGDCAGEWVAWGTHNKDLPVRQVNPNRWEFRFLDVTANMYLSIAAILVAGIAGMKRQQPLTISDVQLVPSALSHAEAGRQLQAYGVTESMPSKLEQALDAAKHDEELQGWVGTELFEQYVKVKDKEVEYFSKMTDEDRKLVFVRHF
ncbi:protein fluG [Mollisia scopiformis]|uniref:Glutamine synthetase n=1 Tax=Mollisia scopiformis TaxID=149040 RepID=A0A132B4S4_MOLSC|nr:protein fluG [Mollisia scopiformis]KUJ07406.1 protein fluG [Mollisia scopiformis]